MTPAPVATHSADEHAAMNRLRDLQRKPMLRVRPPRFVVSENRAVRNELRKLVFDDRDEVTDEDLAELEAARPRTRGDCERGMRPCPFVGCRHHLMLDVGPESGSIKLHFEDLDAMADTCALDVADRGEHTLAEVGDAMNVTRERIRQLEASAGEVIHLELCLAGISPSEALASIAAHHNND